MFSSKEEFNYELLIMKILTWVTSQYVYFDNGEHIKTIFIFNISYVNKSPCSKKVVLIEQRILVMSNSLLAILF